MSINGALVPAAAVDDLRVTHAIDGFQGLALMHVGFDKLSLDPPPGFLIVCS